MNRKIEYQWEALHQTYYQKNFLQNLEDKHFDRIIKNHNIKLLARYVHDIIIIFDNTKTSEIQILDLNNLHNKIKFILEQGKDNTLNYLVLTIERNQQKGILEIEIYHKPTSNNLPINSKSCHSYNQKLSIFNSLIRRLLTIPLRKLQ